MVDFWCRHVSLCDRNDRFHRPIGSVALALLAVFAVAVVTMFDRSIWKINQKSQSFRRRKQKQSSSKIVLLDSMGFHSVKWAKARAAKSTVSVIYAFSIYFGETQFHEHGQLANALEWSNKKKTRKFFSFHWEQENHARCGYCGMLLFACALQEANDIGLPSQLNALSLSMNNLVVDYNVKRTVLVDHRSILLHWMVEHCPCRHQSIHLSNLASQMAFSAIRREFDKRAIVLPRLRFG